MTPDEELERGSQIADAKLGVAEDFSWPVALLVGIVVYQQWGNWLLAALGSVAAFVLSVFKLKRAAAQAEDAWYRSAKLGKYALGPSEREI